MIWRLPTIKFSDLVKNTPALKLRKYSFSGVFSDLIFYDDKFQEKLYYQLKLDYKRICGNKKSEELKHNNLDLCCIAGGLISYGELDLRKKFIYNHPLYMYNENQNSIDDRKFNGYLYILLDSVIRLFPVPSEIKKGNWAIKMREFDFWIDDNLSNLEWNEKEGQYVFLK
jgi:hypothetical protein